MRLARVIKGAVFVVLAIVSVYAGFVFPAEASLKILMLLLVALAGLAVAAIHLHNSLPAIAVLVVTAVAFPYQFGGGQRAPLNSSVLLAAAVCALWMLGVALRGRRALPDWGRPVLAAMTFMAVAAVSFAAGQFSAGPVPGAPLGAQAAQLFIFFVSAGLFSIAGELIGNEAKLSRLTVLFLAAGALACVIQMLPTRLFPLVLERAVRMVSPSTIGSVFWVWLVAMSFSQAVFNRTLPQIGRVVLASIAGLAILRGVVLARSWASGWLPPLVAVLAILVFRLPRFTVIVAALAGALFLRSAPAVDSLTPSEEQYSAITRVEAARVLWPLIKADPVLGTGPANYYYYVSAKPILGWYVKFNSHNQYLDLAAQLGAAGLLAFGWLMFEIGSGVWRLRRRFHGDFGEAYLIGTLAGLAGTLVSGALADWILPFYYNVGLGGLRSSLLFWVFAGGAAALTRSPGMAIQPGPDTVDRSPMAAPCASCS